MQLFDNLQPPIYIPPVCHAEINFTKNYNSKLYGKYFTSIRIPGAKWIIGEHYKVILDDRMFTRAKLLHITIVQLHELPKYTAMLDTGMDLAAAKQLLTSIYGESLINQYGLAVLMFENIEIV
jgi:hypothetical protein